MSTPLSPIRLVRESVPLLGIVFLWTIPAALLSSPLVADSLRFAGVVMALLYAGIRGLWLADSVQYSDSPPTASSTDSERLVWTNLVALAAAGVWFLLALLADAVWGFAGLGGAFVLAPLQGLQFAFAATGVVTVVMYALVVGKTIVDRRDDGQSRSDPSGTVADD